MPGPMPKKPMKPAGKSKLPPFVDPRIAARKYEAEMGAKERLATGRKPSPPPPGPPRKPEQGGMMGRKGQRDVMRLFGPGDKPKGKKK